MNLPPPATPQYRYENHPDDGTITGLELELRWSALGRATGFINYAAQSHDAVYGRVDSTGVPLEFTYAPEHKVNFGTYFGPFKRVRGAFELQWKGEYVGPQMWYLIESNFTDPTIHPLDSYTLVDLSAEYALRVPAGRPAVSVTFRAANIGDVKYESVAGYRAPGRQLLAGARISY